MKPTASNSVLLAILLMMLTGTVFADTPDPLETRVYTTKRIEGQPPSLDGYLDDSIWETVDWSGDFIQRQPADGEPPSAQTMFKVLYDDEAIYFAFRAFDNPDLTTRMLARRDWFPGDWVEVNIDSYHDMRTAFSFTLSLSGTRGDEFISNDGNNWDGSWDPIWEGVTQLDDEGWTAETRIPLSQLRFSPEDVQTWGLQVQRRIFRQEERSTWQRIPNGVSGWVSRFGELRGIQGIKPSRRIELLPYAVTSTENFEADAGNPFRDGTDSMASTGLDGKIGLTSDLTVDFTINPDFGQVEADPSQVNLTAFETYFREQRPFFVEGANIFDLQVAPAITGGSFTRDNLFYSRRIGKRPTYYPNLGAGEYANQPDNTSILGAFKLSGKTAGGTSIGILESVTASEEAEIASGGETRWETVEPMTNYFVGRLQQDYREGQTQIGGMVTAVNRRIKDDHLDFLRRQAYAGGVDFLHCFTDRDCRLEINLLGSNLRGSQAAIYEAQTSSARYFQRPDNDSATLDPQATAISGHAGSARFTRRGSGKFMFQTGAAWRSPGFEINDLGYMRNADEINQFTWAGYYLRDPFSIFNNLNFNSNQWLNWDMAGNFLGARGNVNVHTTFKNRYNMGGGISRSGETVSNSRLRGGPSSKWPGELDYDFYVNSDRRKKLSVSWGVWGSRSDHNSSRTSSTWLHMTYRPSNAIRLSLNPDISYRRPKMQFIGSDTFADSDRYLFSSLDQKTASLTFRLDYCITPNLTVQYYGSPFVSSGKYSEFKRITDPHADVYQDRYETFADDQLAYSAGDEAYHIDENRDGITDYSISNPDFNFRDFNSNLVVRWEFQPGSTMYLVWSQSRSDFINDGRFDFRQGVDELFAVRPHNVFLLKINKWFSM